MRPLPHVYPFVQYMLDPIHELVRMDWAWEVHCMDDAFTQSLKALVRMDGLKVWKDNTLQTLKPQVHTPGSPRVYVFALYTSTLPCTSTYHSAGSQPLPTEATLSAALCCWWEGRESLVMDL